MSTNSHGVQQRKIFVRPCEQPQGKTIVLRNVQLQLHNPAIKLSTPRAGITPKREFKWLICHSLFIKGGNLIQWPINYIRFAKMPITCIHITSTVITSSCSEKNNKFLSWEKSTSCYLGKIMPSSRKLSFKLINAEIDTLEQTWGFYLSLSKHQGAFTPVKSS